MKAKWFETEILDVPSQAIANYPKISLSPLSELEVRLDEKKKRKKEKKIRYIGLHNLGFEILSYTIILAASSTVHLVIFLCFYSFPHFNVKSAR